MINDLIGLRHESGANFSPNKQTIDCFALFSETRRRLGLYDYYDDFKWVYNASSDTLPIIKIFRQIKKIAVPTNSPRDGDLVVLPAKTGGLGLGVVINDGILTITDKNLSFWRPIFLGAKFWTPINETRLN